MKIICKKADLVKAVQTVSKAVPMKSSTTILECILLRAVNIMVRRSRQSGVARATCPD